MYFQVAMQLKFVEFKLIKIIILIFILISEEDVKMK